MLMTDPSIGKRRKDLLEHEGPPLHIELAEAPLLPEHHEGQRRDRHGDGLVGRVAQDVLFVSLKSS